LDPSIQPPDYLNYFGLLGLCGPKDAPIIRGSAKTQDKIAFLKEFTDLVVLNTSKTAIPTQSAQAFLSDIVSDAKAILSPQITLFPSDMDPIYATKGSNTPSVDVESLISSAKSELNDVSSKLAKLDLNEVQTAPIPRRTDIEELKKELKAKFGQLQKVMERFDAVYDLEIKPWVRDSKEEHAPGVGQQASKLLEMQKSLKLALTSIRQLKSGYQQIVAPESSSDLSRIDLEINEHAILAVQDQCSILEKSMARHQEAGAFEE
jgi:hypothetical protein